MGGRVRHDIQVLRGVAVLLVVFHHAAHGWLPYGDLGVDIFFVISGFLMTKMIATDLDRGTFSFRNFYLRRARRLLPASLVTITGTALLAIMLLPDWRLFGWEVIGSLTFTANIVAQIQMFSEHWQQPLSHFWSLSLEEQFYFLFPLFLWISPKQFRGLGIGVIAAFSLAVMVMTTRNYLLPARAWELLVGALAFCIREAPMPRAAKWAALGVLVPSIAFDALLPVVAATAAMLVGKDDWVKLSALERIGDWSYSLYLIHWPLLSFAALYYAAPAPLPVAFTLCAVAIGLAALQYRYVEQPWRLRDREGTNLAARPCRRRGKVLLDGQSPA
jgi:peptidoglycan/LPS O-acetylase OafA/YrhL